MAQKKNRPKINVNLEDAVLQEQKLWEILEMTRNSQDPLDKCEDWFHINEKSTML
jgi:hypothetical protein